MEMSVDQSSCTSLNVGLVAHLSAGVAPSQPLYARHVGAISVTLNTGR